MDLHEKRPDVHSTFIDSYCSEVSKGETTYLNPEADSAASSDLGQEPKDDYAIQTSLDSLVLNHRVTGRRLDHWTTAATVIRAADRKSTRLNSSHTLASRMPSSA